MTLSELYALFDELAPYRRRAAASILDHPRDTDDSLACERQQACRDALGRLSSALGILESLPGEDVHRELTVDGRGLRLNLDYEFEELRRDLICLSEGMSGVARSIRAAGSFEDELASVTAMISDVRYSAVFTDRDGTIANYCGRYRSSHQPLYAAVRIGRFARGCSDHFFIVTSGPLYGHGLVSLGAFPEGTVHLAGSKGREYLLADGTSGSFPLSAGQDEIIASLDERIGSLLGRPEFGMLAVIGSGYQRKFGQLTVSRQDIHRSVPTEVSVAFLDEVRSIVHELDPDRSRLEIDDTGFDVEITLTASGECSRGFDKGDGIRFLIDELDLDVHRAPVLVCGDTTSDAPMLEQLADAGCETHAVFVAPADDLARRVRRHASRAAFCSGPDVLVAAFGAAGREEELNGLR